MRCRPLGQTDLQVSEIGFGTWPIGGDSYGLTNSFDSICALRRAFDLGVNLYDTADIYGSGTSEKLIAEALSQVRDKIILVSKVGYSLRNYDIQNFSNNHIRQALKSTLQRLNTKYTDVYLLHSPTSETLRNGKALRTLESIKDEGSIGFVGVSVRNSEDGYLAIDYGCCSVIEIVYNVLDQSSVQSGFLQKCRKKGVGVIIKVPLCYGFLTGKYNGSSKFGFLDHRRRFSHDQIDLWTQAAQKFYILEKSIECSMAQNALRFVLSNPDVSTAIPGMKNIEQVEKNVITSSLGHFSEKELAQIQDIYIRNKEIVPKSTPSFTKEKLLNS